jgi:hypothetical protein
MPQPEARMKISRLVGTVVVALGLLLAAPVAAQQPGTVYRIGMLLHGNDPSDPGRIAFRESLRALGWVEGQNYVLELRFAAGQADRFPTLRRRTGPAQGRRHRHRRPATDMRTAKALGLTIPPAVLARADELFQ